MEDSRNTRKSCDFILNADAYCALNECGVHDPPLSLTTRDGRCRGY